MTPFNAIFSLAKRLAKSLKKGQEPKALTTSKLFSEDSKERILKELDEDKIEQEIELLKSIDTDADWQTVFSQLEPQPEPSHNNVYKIAAAILLSVTVGYFIIYKFSTAPELEQGVSSIAPGSDKAVLTLGDGSEIALESDQIYKTKEVSSTGERLEYAKSTTQSELVYNYLTIPRGGQYQVELSDGTLVWLNAASKIKYPVAFKSGAPRVVELLYGEAYFDVSPSTEHQGDAFKVFTKDQELEVLGTEFNIKTYPEEESIYTTLVEGQVQIMVDDTTATLGPSKQSAVHTYTKQLTTSRVDVDYHIAWRKGYFNFKDTSLKAIMQVLSRWYDVDITFESPFLEQVKFSGLLSKTQNIEDILNGIKNTKFISAYEIKQKTITIK